MAEIEVPDIVIGRLPIYLRALNHLLAANKEFTSSQELGRFWASARPKSAKTCPILANLANKAPGMKSAI
jgi:hypothetical protein